MAGFTVFRLNHPGELCEANSKRVHLPRTTDIYHMHANRRRLLAPMNNIFVFVSHAFPPESPLGAHVVVASTIFCHASCEGRAHRGRAQHRNELSYTPKRGGLLWVRQDYTHR